MIVIPAIDIKGGRCVRLTQGRMDEETVYSDDPSEVARRWAAADAEIIHLVDLDAAVIGKPVNIDVVKRISEAVSVPLQIGGGIRNEAIADEYLAMDGIKRIIIGTWAHEDPEAVSALAAKYPGRVAVGIDAKDGLVAIKGWVDVTTEPASELARKFEGMGIAAIIYTDISRDGMLAGPDTDAMKEMATLVDIPVIASGGVGSIEDVVLLKDTGVAAVIIGKALYSGDVDLKAAIEASGS